MMHNGQNAGHIKGVVDQSRLINSVLTVDDDPILTSILHSFFTDINVPCIYSAENGCKALNIIDHKDVEIDFILCDLNMPQLDGIQFLRLLAERKFEGGLVILSSSEQPIVALAERLAETHNLNILGSLRKPLNYEELRHLVLDYKAQHSKSARLPAHHFSEGELSEAISNGDIINYYQPKIDALTGRLIGVESLVRWKHAEWGIISPDSFIPLAEDARLMDDLTDVVIDHTIEDAKRWRRLKYDIKSAVNLSVSSLNNVDLPNRLTKKIDFHGLERNQFIIEITENKVLRQDALAMEILARLRMQGFELSIDDFGTGYSNIERLREFPFNELKIDQSFVRRSSEDSHARSIVESCSILGRDLGLRLVAEGIETEEDRKFVTDLGVDLIQGYLYAKPMPIDELLSWFLEYQPSQLRRRRA